ncbi:carbon-nitrogen hydrolase family protein [Halorussus salinisoli]|uniref:carbon-nitrogen hydrolase family protein n=1 Tax=Halorussus salinisoli TaxID=2558242 RepID=UPI0010C1FFD9|nr:carbon-nitrogen hydrolase family protein [Halorussus salinisoli]
MSANERVAACQFEPTIGDVAGNLEALERTLDGLPSSVAVAVFPELCVTGYDLDVAQDRATPVPGELTDRLVSIIADHDVTVVAGVPERDGEQLYNSLVVVDGDGVRDTYRKQHLWGDEADVFATGDGPQTVETRLGTVGLALCYDLNFPEVGLDYAREGCDVLAVSAAWRTSYEADWRLLLRARALDGPYYVVGANHAGDQRGRDHAGRSLVVDPTGTVLSEVTEGDGHAVVTVEPERIEAGRDRNPVQESRGWT